MVQQLLIRMTLDLVKAQLMVQVKLLIAWEQKARMEPQLMLLECQMVI